MKELDPNLTLTFVSGPPRSGTTLLAGMLAGEGVYPMLPECTFMTGLIRSHSNIRLYGDAARKAAYVGSDEKLDDIFRPSIVGLVANAIDLLDGPPRQHLVLKDPELTPYISDLPRFFANPMRTVLIVRDPRDMIASVVKASKASLGEAIQNALRDYYYVGLAVTNAQAENPVLLVRYEDLVTQDAATMDRIEAFVGFRIQRTGYGEVAQAFDKADPYYSELYGKPVSAERVGASENSLTPSQLIAIEEALGHVIGRYQYPQRPRPPHVRLLHRAGRLMSRR